MRVESNVKPLEKYKIERLNGQCTVYFFDNITEETRQKENEETEIFYKYDRYKINPFYRDNLQEDIEENYQAWLDFAKQKEVDELSTEIRQKRNKLLDETDKDMVLDRLKLDIPDDISMTTIVNTIKSYFTSLKEVYSSELAKYRQALRDIPQQSEFPYNVAWPEKPKTNEKEEK